MGRCDAAVVGGSLLSFLPGISPEQRQAVQLAILFTERVTQQDHAAGYVADWYSYYRRRLQFLGWDALPPEQAHWPEPQRKAIVDKALEMVEQVAGKQHASSLSLALSALLRSDMALLHLEERSKELGVFQLLPCAPGKNGYIDMVVYHEAGERNLFRSGFLTRSVESTVVRAELVRFNVRLFQQQHEALVRSNVERVMRREILTLDF